MEDNIINSNNLSEEDVINALILDIDCDDYQKLLSKSVVNIITSKNAEIEKLNLLLSLAYDNQDNYIEVIKSVRKKIDELDELIRNCRKDERARIIELIKKSATKKTINLVMDASIVETDLGSYEITEQQLNDILNNDNNDNENKINLKVGDEIWVIDREDGEVIDISCIQFLAKSKGCIIGTAWINDLDIDETIEYHIKETRENFDCELKVYPDEDCFATKEEAEQALKEREGK